MRTQLSLLIMSVQSQLLTLVSICLAFFIPISGILLMIGVLIIFDTVAGIWKAKKLGEKITSRRLSAIISKLALYELTVIMFFLIDRLKGAANAGKAVAFFANSQDQLPKIESLPTNGNDSLFQEASQLNTEQICFSHTIDPILMGIRTTGSLGNGSDIKQAYIIFEKNVVTDIRDVDRDLNGKGRKPDVMPDLVDQIRLLAKSGDKRISYNIT